MPDTVKSVVIIEDNPLIAEKLQQMIEADHSFSSEGVFHSYSEAIAYLEHHAPDLLLIDLGLPDGHGEDIIAWVESNNQSKAQSTACLVLTMYADEAHVMKALAAGAMGYLLKDTGTKYIIKALHDIVQGGSPITPVIARSLLNQFAKKGKTRQDIPEKNQLTPKEEQVLSLFSKGFNRKEIAGLMQISVNTVNSHAKHIFKKLAVHTQSEAVYAAVQQGMIQLG
ncbi:MAG: response regulator transcription factor [Ghiorsea sp.]